MKKGRILGVLLAAAMAFGGVTGAVGTRSVKADGSSNYKFDKQYLLKAGDSETAESPAETFSFDLAFFDRTKFSAVFCLCSIIS